MLKITGAIMIIFAGSLIGVFKAYTLKKRWDSLSLIIHSLQIMENEISYARNSMDRIFNKITDLGGLLFNENGSQNVEKAFINTISNPSLYLEKGEKEILSSFAKTLGKTDTDVQLKTIKNTTNSLELLRKDAKNNYEKYGKMHRSIGALSGILIVILLM